MRCRGGVLRLPIARSRPPGPDSVTDWLAFSAPSSSGLPVSARNSRAASTPSARAAMRPRPRVRSCCRLRATTTRAASASGKRAGRPCRADLSDAVADMRLRLDPEPAQHRDDADLHREEQRLRDIGMRQLLGVGAAFQPLADRPAQRREQGRVREADRVAERGTRPVGVAPHLRPLGAVAGEHEGELRVAHGGSGHDRRRFRSRRRNRQARRRCRPGRRRA